MKAVIQAGGKGSRLRKITKDVIPKPLAIMNGKSILDIQISQLIRYGIRDITIIVGYKGDQIQEHFGDGSDLGIRLDYIYETEPLGSAGALFYLKQKMKNEDFIFLFGDIIFSVNLNKMIKFHKFHKGAVTLLVHPNNHPQDSDIVILNENSEVKRFDLKNKKRDYWYSNCVNAGIYIVASKLLDKIVKPIKLDFEQDLLKPLLGKKMVYAYRSTEYVKDAGTTERFLSIERDLNNDLIEKRNLEHKQKCIFIDRDGTINEYRGLVENENDLVVMGKSFEAIRKINSTEYLAIMVSNQPVVARGMCSIDDVNMINNKMETLLGEKGAYLDDIMFCPHHPDRGFPEENQNYKIECNCRKPKTGMIDIMKERYNIDCGASYIIGDTTTDIKTGLNAGLKTILVKTGEAGNDGKYDVVADIIANDLLDAVNKILLKSEK